MKRSLFVCSAIAVVAAAIALMPIAPLKAQSRARAENVPTIRHESVPDFLKWPADVYMGEGIGIAQNSKGHVFVYTRAADTRVFEFDAFGNYIREIGAGSYTLEFAHTIRVDAQDNIWTVDEGTNIITKWNPMGRIEMVLGSRPNFLDPLSPQGRLNEKYIFGRPTDVTFDAQGNIFISDGYQNSRVVKYDKNGRFVGQFAGERGSAPNQLSTPHTISSDSRGNIYVGDRGNARVQVLDNNLNLKATFDTMGNPWALCVSPPPNEYLFVSNSNPDSNPAASWEITGEIYKARLDGTILGKFGQAGKQLGQFSTVHEIDCRNPDELLVSEISAWRVQKIRLMPTAAQR